jgi:hypothetical protein
MQELLDTQLFVTGSGEDEAGNIYFTSCECGYGQTAPRPAGSVWMLVAADQVPDGATTAPVSDEQRISPGEAITIERVTGGTPVP